MKQRSTQKVGTSNCFFSFNVASSGMILALFWNYFGYKKRQQMTTGTLEWNEPSPACHPLVSHRVFHLPDSQTQKRPQGTCDARGRWCRFHPPRWISLSSLTPRWAMRIFIDPKWCQVTPGVPKSCQVKKSGWASEVHPPVDNVDNYMKVTMKVSIFNTGTIMRL